MPVSVTFHNNLVNYTRGVFADSYHHAPAVAPVFASYLCMPRCVRRFRIYRCATVESRTRPGVLVYASWQ